MSIEFLTGQSHTKEMEGGQCQFSAGFDSAKKAAFAALAACATMALISQRML